MAVASNGHRLCKSAPRSRQITTPAPHHSVFYSPDALPAAQPTASKHLIRISDFHQFSDIHISQGSVATYLRCGGILNTNLLQISIEPVIEKILKIG